MPREGARLTAAAAHRARASTRAGALAVLEHQRAAWLAVARAVAAARRAARAGALAVQQRGMSVLQGAQVRRPARLSAACLLQHAFLQHMPSAACLSAACLSAAYAFCSVPFCSMHAYLARGSGEAACMQPV